MDPLDIEVLLAHVLKKDRSWVVAHPEYVLTKNQESQFEDCLKRRRSGEPVAYIVGEKEFYGRRFMVDQRVLIPRPSTEGLVEMVLQKFEANSKSQFQITKQLDTGIVGVFIMVSRANHDTMTLVDIGTGSGCIAITLALELLNCSLSRGGGKISNVRIIATDISPDALEVARENARRHGVEGRIEFRQGNLLEPIMDLSEPFIIVSNPPYVAKCHGEPDESMTCAEPPIALLSGPKGMDVLLPLIEQAKKHPYCMGIFLECQENQIPLLLDTCKDVNIPSVKSVP